MIDATSLTQPVLGLSAILLPNKSVEPYSPKGPADVTITLYRCSRRLFRAATRHNDSCCDLVKHNTVILYSYFNRMFINMIHMLIII